MHIFCDQTKTSAVTARTKSGMKCGFSGRSATTKREQQEGRRERNQRKLVLGGGKGFTDSHRGTCRSVTHRFVYRRSAVWKDRLHFMHQLVIKLNRWWVTGRTYVSIAALKPLEEKDFFKRFHLEMNPVIKSLLDSQWDTRNAPRPLHRRERCIFFFLPLPRHCVAVTWKMVNKGELLCKLINSLRASTLNSWGSNHRQRWHGHRLDGQGVVFHGALHQLRQLWTNRDQYKANFELPRCSGVVFLTSDLVKERHGAMSSL